MSSDISRQFGNILRTGEAILPHMAKKETRESLRDYLIRVCREDNLNPSDIERNSRGGITESYVRGLMQEGGSNNPSVEKLQALARGLRRSEDEVFDKARGIDRNADQKTQLRLRSLFDRAKELTDENDLTWFEETIDVIDRELERRSRLKKK